MPLSSPRLWVVATPIGNPGDLSPRAREILANASLILAEDTRRTASLLAACGIPARKMLSFFEHNEDARQGQALAALQAGNDIALVTDAGTPLLSDPGYRLVRACRQAHLPVSPVPGPSAPLAALSAAGIAPLPFTFLGFLPRGIKARKDLFAAYGATPATLIFFERKDRIRESMALALECLGEREFAICRELTKEHEEFILGRLGGADSLPDALLGEITVVIGPPAGNVRTPEAEARALLARAVQNGLKNRAAAKLVKTQCRGWTAAELYDLLARGGDGPGRETDSGMMNGVY